MAEDADEARVHEVPTPTGPARAHVWTARGPARGPVLVLGHGAGGGVQATDLRSATGLTEHGWHVVLVEQPWRVAGRRVAGPPRTLDPPWLAVLASPELAALRRDDADAADGADATRPLVVGGRSAGARVACRTAVEAGADAVLALSFPLHPPGKPEKSRAAELTAPIGAGLPVLVLQGERDAFGRPAEVEDAAPGAAVVAVPGDHTPRVGAEDLRGHVLSWWSRLLPG